MAANATVFKDGHDNYEDWVEIWNPDATSVDLAGWRLTDNAGNLAKFVFPAKVIPAGGRLVVFCSNRAGSTGAATHIDPLGYLHTNFSLAKGGEYLALVLPDGTTKASEFTPNYPQQIDDISYGSPASTEALVGSGATVRFSVPTSTALDTASPNWRASNFNDTGWASGIGPGVGFEAGATTAAWPLDESAGATSAADATGQGSTAGLNGTGQTFGVSGASAGTATAVQFSGAGGLTVPYRTALNPDATFTFAAWVYPTSNNGNHQAVVSSRVGPAGIQRGYILYMAPSGGTHRWEFWTGTLGTWHTVSGPNVIYNAWTHVAISRDAAGTKRLYINGTMVASAVGAYVPNNNTANGFHLGIGDDTGGDFRMIGKLDDATFWSTDIGAALIDSHRLSGGGSFPTAAYASHYGINVQAQMFGVNPGIYTRHHFSVADKSRFAAATIRVKYDDAFVAYLNGTEIARRNFAGVRAFNSVADTDRSDTSAVVFENIDVTATALPAMANGANTLSIHGMRPSAAHDSFLLTPQLEGGLTPEAQAPGYFAASTPGTINSASNINPGPAISAVAHTPAQPAPGQAISVTAHVTPRLGAISGVSLKYRVMYGVESAAIAMSDAGPVLGATDGSRIFTGTIPGSHGAAARQMLRYYITATDTSARTWRAPYPTDLSNDDGVSQSPEYFGTVIADAALTASMPIMQWFTNDVANSDTRTGSRASAYFGGVFYDNIYVRQRGGFTSTGSQKFNFNRGDNIYVNATLGKVGELNMNSSGADPTHFRVSLAYDLYRTAGHPACESFPTAMYRNGSFHRMAQCIEQVDEDYLKRWGFDNDGALYKFVQRTGEENTPGNVVGGDYSGSPGLKNEDPIYGVEKKTREYEDFTDFKALTAGLASGTASDKKNFLFRNINLPNFVNFMAIRALISEEDVNRKNFYMLRDTEKSGEWFLLPWDKDFTTGVNYSNVVSSNRNNPWQSTATFYHDPAGTRQWCVIFQSGYDNLEIRAMVGRRLRTLIDTMMGQSGAAIPGSTIMEQRLEAVRAQLATQPPGVSIGGSYNNRSTFDTWLANHRTDLFTTYGPASGYNMIPSTASALPVVSITNAAANPASASPGFSPQDHEFIEITNSNAEEVDISRWTLWNPGASKPIITFAAGTVIPKASFAPYHKMVVARDLPGFRGRPGAPATGEFAVGTYDGQLSARGETIELRAGPLATDRLVSTFSTPSAPTAAQQQLRITELMFAPAQPSAGELAAAPGSVAADYEFIELANIHETAPLVLDGARFTDGIDFTFPAFSLPAGARCIIVANATAFAARYGTPGTVVGAFTGSLDNSGERIRIEDAVGEMILDFRYEPSWYPVPAGQNRSIVPRSVSPDYATYDLPTHWALSGSAGGTPGTGETSSAAVYEGWRWDYFAEAEIYLPSPPNPDGTEDAALVSPSADAEGDLLTNLAEYAYARNPRTGDNTALTTASIITDGANQYLAITFTRRTNALDLTYTVETTGDLSAQWDPTTIQVGPTTSLPGGVEVVTFRDTIPSGALPRYIRVRAVK